MDSETSVLIPGEATAPERYQLVKITRVIQVVVRVGGRTVSDPGAAMSPEGRPLENFHSRTTEGSGCGGEECVGPRGSYISIERIHDFFTGVLQGGVEVRTMFNPGSATAPDGGPLE